jgi:RND superfamily putative drug exporter
MAWRGAFEPIIASGGTVIAGLLCLLLSDLASNRALGPIASIGIAFAVLSALTFLPALLAIFGRAAFWPFIPKGADGDPGDNAERLVTDPSAPVRGFWGRQAAWSRATRGRCGSSRRSCCSRHPSACCS